MHALMVHKDRPIYRLMHYTLYTPL